jgi:phospholipid-binding lipoprotein MlaA
VLLANDVLEGKPRRAGDTLMRFVINSTAGVGGFFDVADGWGYPSHEADFGMTLAVWGVDPGPFLYLPVLGPSDPRDAFGFGVDIAIDPFTWVGNGGVVQDLGYVRYGMSAVDARDRYGSDLDKVKEQALDPYATFRSLYRQHREGQIDAIRNDDRATTPGWYSAPAPQ